MPSKNISVPFFFHFHPAFKEDEARKITEFWVFKDIVVFLFFKPTLVLGQLIVIVQAVTQIVS